MPFLVYSILTFHKGACPSCPWVSSLGSTCWAEPTFLVPRPCGPLSVCSDSLSPGPVSIVNFVFLILLVLHLSPHSTDHIKKEKKKNRTRAQRIKRTEKRKKERNGHPLISFPLLSCLSGHLKDYSSQESPTTLNPGAALEPHCSHYSLINSLPFCSLPQTAHSKESPGLQTPSCSTRALQNGIFSASGSSPI